MRLPLQEFLPALCDTSMWLIPKNSMLRRGLVTLVHWRVFEMVTLLAILANCVTLALDRCAQFHSQPGMAAWVPGRAPSWHTGSA